MKKECESLITFIYWWHVEKMFWVYLVEETDKINFTCFFYFLNLTSKKFLSLFYLTFG
jgi:hypothetical protein